MLPLRPTYANHNSDHCRRSGQGLNHSRIPRGDSEGDSYHAEYVCRSPSRHQVRARGLSVPGQTCNAAQACVECLNSRGSTLWPSMVSILHVVFRDYLEAHSLWRTRVLLRSDFPVHECLYQLSGNVDFFSSPELWREGLCVPRDLSLLISSKTYMLLTSSYHLCSLTDERSLSLFRK